MASSIKYAKVIIVFIIVFAIFLVCTNLFFVSEERKKLDADFNSQSKNELHLIGTFVTEPLLEQQFAVVEQFVLQWGNKSPGIIELKALSPDGFQLAQFKRSARYNHTAKFHHSVNFMGQHLLDLEIVKDLSPVELHLERFWKLLIIQSLIVLSVLGITIWFIIKKMALNPLEDEITRRKDAELNLQKAHSQLETKIIERTLELASEKELLAVTLRAIGEGVITTDIAGSVVLMNKMAEDLTGWGQEEAFGRPILEVFHTINERNREICESLVEKVIKTGQIVGLAKHTVLIGKDAREFIISNSAAPIRDKASIIVGVVIVFNDITDQQRTEREIIKAKKLESVGVLAGGIAHDFNNILAAILGNINLALFDADLKDKTKELLTKAEKASLRAKNLTQQLLTFSKGGDPVKEASSLETVIKDSANFVLHGDMVACQFDIPENLWIVNIDKGQISQVIQNIVLNASHAMPDGGIIKVCCENNISSEEKKPHPLSRKGRYVKICISDTGIGIPTKVIEKIFDPYFSTKQEGSGLGLAISQSIISKHDGYITVKSAPGVGTDFSIHLPASIHEKAQDHQPEALFQESTKAKILVVDDDEMVRFMAKEMLEHLGHTVTLSENGVEAIKLYLETANTNKKFDLVIVDLTIPGGMGGKDTVKEILAIDSNAKVIVSSGYSNDPVMSEFKDYGFCSSLVKPYQLQELSKLISKTLD